MISKILKYVLILSIVGLISACSLHQRMHEKAHQLLFEDEVMRGQIVSVEGDQVVVYIGSKSGAQAGTVLNVSAVKYDGAIAKGTGKYTIQTIGAIEITSIIDEHFARGHILRGLAAPNNVVESSDN